MSSSMTVNARTDEEEDKKIQVRAMQKNWEGATADIVEEWCWSIKCGRKEYTSGKGKAMLLSSIVQILNDKHSHLLRIASRKALG